MKNTTNLRDLSGVYRPLEKRALRLCRQSGLGTPLFVMSLGGFWVGGGTHT